MSDVPADPVTRPAGALRSAVASAYGPTYERALRLVLEADPVELSFGDNTDEYEDEVAHILARLVAARAVADAHTVVLDVFREHFDAESVGDERRLRPLASGLWQLHQRAVAERPAAIARLAWGRGRLLDAGRLLYEALPSSARPAWAAGVLRTVTARLPAPSDVRDLLAIADAPARWPEAKAAFDAIRRLRNEPVPDAPPADALLALAELVAKVTYNATAPSAPFDHSAGWKLVPALHALLAATDDPEFTAAAETAVFAMSPAPAA